MKEWEIENDKLEILKNSLLSSKQKLEEMLHEQNELAILKGELSELDLEVEYFNKYYDENKYKIQPYRSMYKLNSNDVMSILVKYETIIGRYGTFKLRHKIMNLIWYGIISFKFYKNSSEAIVDHLKKIYYELKLGELNRTIDLLINKLEKNNFEELMSEYSEDSMQVLKSNLSKKFITKGSRTIFTKDILWKNIEGFLKEYPVILSTTHSLRSCASENYLFDYVIVDEASQVDIVTGALALSCAKNVVIVGDLKQLPVDILLKRSGVRVCHF